MTIQFSLPINEAKKTAEGLQQIFHGDVEINATVTIDHEFPNEMFPDVDYESIKWKGVDILPLLDNIEGGADEMMNYFYEATVQHARNYSPEKSFV